MAARPRRAARWAALLLAAVCVTSGVGGQQLELPLGRVRLPPGFVLELYYSGKVPGARSLGLARSGAANVVYVGSRGAGQTDDIAAAVGKVGGPVSVLWFACFIYF